MFIEIVSIYQFHKIKYQFHKIDKITKTIQVYVPKRKFKREKLYIL